MKKLLKSVVVVLLALLPLPTLAYDVEINGIYYDLSDGQATVTRNESESYTGDVVIPASIVYGGVTHSVTSIGDEAFFFCSGLTSVVIPNSITSIGDGAFIYCSSLTSVVIPNSITSIGNSAFSYCI